MTVMITHYPYQTLGHANHGWLDARHHFSFANYWNPERTQFGALRVINDDMIAAGRGFGMHGHDNMEIITYVRQGGITHQDNLGNTGRTGAGDVQVMSAGRGVIHAEHNREDEQTRLYQIWIEPNKQNVEPCWAAKAFPKQQADGALSLLVSGMAEHEGQGALFIHQDAAIYGGRLAHGQMFAQPIKHQAYVLASSGRFTVNGTLLNAGDGAEGVNEPQLHIQALSDAEVIIIDVPA
jgi:quercetin 2,3-dioxygenase